MASQTANQRQVTDAGQILTGDEQKRHIHKALEFFHPKGSVFEIRALGPSTPKSEHWEGYAGGKKGIISGYYDDTIKATEAVAALDSVGCEGIYVTMNEVDPALLGRASNRLKVADKTTSDQDIPVLRRILIDMDPARPAGISSTDEEHEEALKRAAMLRGQLTAKGWPQPLYGDSGNGAHLIYLLSDLENSQENVNLLRDTLNALWDIYRVGVPSKRNSGFIQAEVDRKVFNPSRISKLYGTFARKGDNTQDRPHRQSRILELPKEPQAVSIELLKATLAELKATIAKLNGHQPDRQRTSRPTLRKPGNTSSGNFRLAEYLDKYNIPVKEVKEHQGATLNVLHTCLFDGNHTGGEAAIGQAADGKLFYHCFHNSCKDKTWHDAREKISGSDPLGEFIEGYQARRSQGSGPFGMEDQDEDSDFELKEWPSLPERALAGIAGEFVELATRKSEADPAAVLATFLVRVGIECGTGPHMMIGDSKHCARINAVIVGNSSKARKGTSGRPVSRVFNFNAQERGIDYPSFYSAARETPGPLSSGEGLIYAVRDQVKKWDVNKKTGEGKWIIDDPGVDDKRLFVLDEELAAALQCTRREGNTLSTVIRSAFDNGNLDPLTKTNRISATGAHIGIVSHITSAELHKLLDETQVLNGFANRYLWICARRQKLVPIPEPMPERELRKIQCKLLQIFDAVKSIELVSFSAKARETWIEMYPRVADDHLGFVGCVINRAEAIVCRLSLIYALLDASKTIEVKHLESALAFWTYAKESAEYIFAGRETNPISQKILDACELAPVSLTDIYGLFSNHVTKRQIGTAVQELIASGKVKVQDEETTGRPKKNNLVSEKSERSERRVSSGYSRGALFR
ncbi:MAG: hypothetical protein WAN11_22360 [Syntrophobacteraceae bacterium]